MTFIMAIQVDAQLSITTVETDHTIDFETTVSGINEGTFDGSGFESTPAIGQLDANGWAIIGMSDGDKDFGTVGITGDFARGTSTGGEISGGVYSFEVEPGNNALGIQAAGTDFTPGWMGMIIQNNTGDPVNAISISYNLWVYNDADRANSINAEFSTDGATWYTIDDFLFTTPEAADATPVWNKTSFSITDQDMGFTFVSGDSIYLRWYSADISGSGSRDEIAIDSVIINMKYDCQPVTTFPYTENFEDGFPPPCWSTEGGINWQGSSTNEAGGSPPEADFFWNPSATGIQKLISPVINTSGYSSLILSFKHFLDYNTGGFEIGIATTADAGATWDTLFAIPPMGNIGPSEETFLIDNADIGSSTFQFCFFLEGESSGLYHWYIDDAILRESYTGTDFLSYSFPEQTEPADINDVNHTINVEVFFATDMTNLVATFDLSEEASATVSGISQTSESTANNFTNPVTYAVTAEDGITTQDWIVTVTESTAPQGSDCANAFVVNLPANLPYEDLNQTNCGMGNTYSNTQMSSYDNGEDAIYEINVSEEIVVDIKLDPYSTTYTSLGIFESCPSATNMIENVQSPTADTRIIDSLVLTPGTYYIMVDIWPTGPSCINEYDLTIEINPLFEYVFNTNMMLTPNNQTINVNQDANGLLEVSYPTTIAPEIPSDFMTDVQIDLSELPSGTLIELLEVGSSLGTYTVSGGETVWASQAFTSVSRVAANTTEGQSFSWDVVISNLIEGTYNLNATMYLGTDANLNAETNIAELDSDVMEIVVEPLVIDIALMQPASSYNCDFTDAEPIPVEFKNVGEATISAGETINFTFNDGGSLINEDFTLTEDILPGDAFSSFTSETVNLSALGVYPFEATMAYTEDINSANDLIEGYIIHFNQEIEFLGEVNDTITIASTDWPYTIETNLTLSTDSVLLSTYEWELDGSTETTLTVNADAWFKLWVTTEDCTTEDSVYVLAYNNINGLTADKFAVHPNPNNGQFMIEMNLVEKQDVILSIFNSNGQLVRKLKFDDIDNFARAIDMNNVAEGLYHIRINAGGKMFNSQVVIH